MENTRVKDIVEAVGGRLLCGDPEMPIANISIDSRKMKGQDLFVPIIGEKVDAHRFIGQAFDQGAGAVFTSRHEEMDDADHAWIRVEDTRMALQALGAWYRGRLTLPLVGITGSVGKTTTREMISAALSAGFRVYKTPGNSNSQVGVPITITEIPSEAQIGVIELGMSEPGEMSRIAQVAQVNQAVMTNIGVAHIEQLGSQENILAEKLHIQDGMKPDGILYVNGDDPLLRTVKAREGCRTITYGTAPDCDYCGEELGLSGGFPVFTAVRRETGERVRVKLHVYGNHMVLNALAALAVSAENGVPMEAAARALEEFGGLKGRQQIVRAGGITVIDDSYNASPVSMKAGIQVLCDVEASGRRAAVLADMKELGPEGPEFHRQVGRFLAEHPVDLVALYGELAAEIGAGLREALESSAELEAGCLAGGGQGPDSSQAEGGQKRQASCGKAPRSAADIRHFSDKEELEHFLISWLKAGDCVLFKGSNSMGLSAAAAAVLAAADPAEESEAH